MRRLACGLLACLLVVHLAFFPVRVRATVAAGALTAVGLAVTVTAFLNLAGIYPFNPDTGEGLTFPEWTNNALQKLIDLYNVAHASAPITAQTVKSYALGATIAVANQSWNRLRDFVDWIKAEYAPADNAQGVQLGAVSISFLPVTINDRDIIFSDGLYWGGYVSGSTTFQYYVSTNTSGVRYFVYHNLTSSSYFLYGFCVDSTFTLYSAVNVNAGTTMTQAVHRAWDGVSSGADVWIASVSGFTDSGFLTSGIPVYTSISGAISELSGGTDTLSGIIADTATVTTPAPPASDSEFTGMQVAGLGQGATADALEDAIESGVQNRERPTVRQVEVEIQVGTEVDSETGAVTENPVVVTPDSVPLVASDFSIPALHTVFPFSIPWDVYNVFSALNAEPVRPSFDASLYVPILDVSIPFRIAIPDEISEDVDSFVALARSLFLVLMCVATLLFVRELIR